MDSTHRVNFATVGTSQLLGWFAYNVSDIEDEVAKSVPTLDGYLRGSTDEETQSVSIGRPAQYSRTALAEDSETAVSIQMVASWAVQHTEIRD